MTRTSTQRKRWRKQDLNADGTIAARAPRKTFAAGGVRRSSSPTSRCRSTTCSPLPAQRATIPIVLIFGLVLSIALMGIAASFIANLLQKHRWIAYVGLAIILYVAGEMIWRGVAEDPARGRRDPLVALDMRPAGSAGGPAGKRDKNPRCSRSLKPPLSGWDCAFAPKSAQSLIRAPRADRRRLEKVMAEVVLIVDDDPVQRRLVEAMVQRFGCTGH